MVFLLLVLNGVLASVAPTVGTLHIQLQNVERAEGKIRVAVFDEPQSFVREEPAVQSKVLSAVTTGAVAFSIPDLSYGHYAIAIYHDINNNGKLDRNTLGIPKEPYAFSNDPHAKWQAPDFEATKFLFSQDQQKAVLTLRTWRDR
jgi:uncharacterized protein (DUF2141 family)